MPLPEAAQASLDRILKSGEYVCRPHRQIFVEHRFTNQNGQVTRQVTPEDLRLIADNGNRKAAETGDLAPIGLGHTYDDVLDENGNVVKKFAEADQPQPIGYLHNYSVEQLPTGKWALFVDEWIKKVLPNEKGEPVDGVQYASTFPRRSAEYFPAKRFIDWLALLRRAPALDMGLDIYAYAAVFPEKIFYEFGSDGASLLGAVEDTRGKVRYAASYAANESEGDSMPPESTAAAAPASPAAPPDDRPPIEKAIPESGGLPPIHKEAAEQYAAHCLGMHHSHAAALMHHMHSMYGAQLGLNPDKHTPHTPQIQTAPASPLMPPASPGQQSAKPEPAPGGEAKPPHHQHSPVGLQGDSSHVHPHHNAAAAGPSVPGAGNAYIPGSEEERRRMSAAQQGIEQHLFKTEVEKLRYERQQLELRVTAMERDTRKANYERDLTGLLGMGYRFDLADEVKDGERWNYAADDCTRQIERIKKNYARPTDGDNGPVMLYSLDGAPMAQMPSRGKPVEPEGVTREMVRDAQRYSQKHGVPYPEAMAKIKAQAGAA